MNPTVGDIYCVYVEKLQQYAACQVTGLKITESKPARQLASVLQLDWSGDQPPDENELRQLKPLICNFYFWKDRTDHSYVSSEIPSDYILAGNIPPLITEETRSYSGDWQIGASLCRQREWEAIEETRRDAFKQAMGDYEYIMVGSQSMPRNTSTLRGFKPQFAEDVAELAKLPCLTHIEMDGYNEAIIPFLINNPFVYELHIFNHSLTTLDLSNSHLTKLVINGSGLKKLILNPGLSHLSFVGSLSPELDITAYEEGRRITLNIAEIGPRIHGISRLRGLYIREIKELDLKPIAQNYPEVVELLLWGKPGNLSGLESLRHFKDLQEFATYDLFAFSGEQFPAPDQLPQLKSLRLTSLPAEAAKVIKTKYKQAAAAGLDLQITKPRKSEWLAENLNNPFRDWDGRDHIAATHAKKAAQLYKKCLKELRQLHLNLNTEDDASVQDQLHAIVLNYTQTFNKMDAKANFIETIEREEIYNALVELLDQVNKDATGDRLTPMNQDALFEVFDQVREF